MTANRRCEIYYYLDRGDVASALRIGCLPDEGYWPDERDQSARWNALETQAIINAFRSTTCPTKS